jgi:succinate dehydrogenase/fumarate reductase flavoprotein subunit
MATILNSKVPSGPLEKKWEKRREESKLVAPNNRRKFDITVVGSGLAGAAAARDLGCLDALERNESCGGHFRVERQTKEGEALRDDDHYCHVAAWEYAGPNARPSLVKESLQFDYVKLSQRSYK